ncbi:MAG: Na/Pi cotransporter family protein [Bacteroidetes bacterium]|nr:Na/Pi cotransporter family protein [Bacteroidota bacterium]MBU1719821.1 Na/Pi cotransporter family protein [Bacteroidota bacterium]
MKRKITNPLLLTVVFILLPGLIPAIAAVNSVTSEDPGNPRWWIMMVIGLLGGLSLFLYGMGMMSEGIRKASGSGLRNFLGKVTKNRFVGAFAGVLSTIMMQSSSALSVLLIGLVQAGMISFPNTVGVLLGSGIGSTITAQLIAFKFTDYALAFVAVGFAFNFARPGTSLRKTGEAILGFGILFFGMHIMSESMHPLRTYEPFLNLLSTLENPATGILAGLAFTAIIQSSAAFIGIVILLSSQGIIGIEAGIPLMLGSNIGTTVTAQLASITSSPTSRQVSMAFTLMKVLGVLLIIWWIPSFKSLTEWITPAGNNFAPRQIANAHTLFNVFILVVMIPFTISYSRLIEKLIPNRPPKRKEKFDTQFINSNLIGTPALAIPLARAETIRMAELAREMIRNILAPFTKRDTSMLKTTKKMEEEIDFLRKHIGDYLTNIGKSNTNEENARELFQLMYTVSEIEEIADIIDNDLIPRAEDWMNESRTFSEEGIADLEEYHLQTLKQISRAINLMKDCSSEKAEHIKAKHKKVQRMAIEMKRNHFERLGKNIPETATSSSMHLHLMTTFRVINSHSTNIGRIILSQANNAENTEE